MCVCGGGVRVGVRVLPFEQAAVSFNNVQHPPFPNILTGQDNTLLNSATVRRVTHCLLLLPNTPNA